jgi:hypothetical protein
MAWQTCREALLKTLVTGGKPIDHLANQRGHVDRFSDLHFEAMKYGCVAQELVGEYRGPHGIGVDAIDPIFKRPLRRFL